MKKIISIISIIVISACILIFLILLVILNINKSNDRKVISYIKNNINIVNTNSLYFDETLSSMQINNNNYVGIIELDDLGIILPVKSRCSALSSACYINKKPLSMLMTNLPNSVSKYKAISKDDNVSFINLYGEKYDFIVNDIKTSNTIVGIDEYDADLVIAIKNYFDLKYIFVLCTFN